MQLPSISYPLSLQTSEQIDAFVQQLRQLLGPVQEKGGIQFCSQTAFIHFVRLFFLSVCSDHGLLARSSFASRCADNENDQAKLLTNIKDTYLQLLKKVYLGSFSSENVLFHSGWCTTYMNILDQQGGFDRFVLEEHTTLALLDLLSCYDFRGLSTDILGRIYNEGFISNTERSEKGQFYTPSHVVDYMLNTLGIPAYEDWGYMKYRAFLEKTVGDLACGSGSFLVAAAARKRAILQSLIARNEASPEYALQILTGTFLGFDLNPFACYLAEINLLMQCLPFLGDKQGQLIRSVNRFHIYCTDVLEPTPTEQANAYLHGRAYRKRDSRPQYQQKQVLSDVERPIIRIKDARGLLVEPANPEGNSCGLDYLLGNPPYVSASEGSNNLDYRSKVSSFGIYQSLHQRWDLFVPFFERNLQFLHPGSGKLGLIVSNGIETEGYAKHLRQVLTSQYCLRQIDFFPNLRLFSDAAIENTIVFVENHPPTAISEVIRRKHLQSDCRHFEMLPTVLQLASNEFIFRWRYDPLLEKSLAEGSIPLCAIVYIGTGIEAQSKENFDSMFEGRRQKRFTLHDVFLASSTNSGTAHPPEYSAEGVLGDDIGPYYLRCKRFVAYEKFRPQMRGPRDIALFRTAEKLLLGETSGGYYDRDGLFANHSVQVAVPWIALEQANALEERGIARVLRKSRRLCSMDGSFATISALFDLRYLLGVINSRFMRRYITCNIHQGTRKNRIYPDVWKRLPIKVTSAERQQQIGVLVDAVQEKYQLLFGAVTEEESKIRETINRLLLEIEALVETTYRESADAEMMEIIKNRANGE